MDAPASNPDPVPPGDSPAGAGGGQGAPEILAVAGTYATQAEGFERGLVVLSMGLAYWLVPAAEGYSLLVESRFAEPVRGEISCFERESVDDFGHKKLGGIGDRVAEVEERSGVPYFRKVAS